MAKSSAANCPHGEEQRDQVKFEKAPLFLFLANDIERIDQGLHAAIGTPKGNA